MRKSLGKILQWILLGVLFLGIPSALADPINTIAGTSALDTSSPRVWRHGTATTTQIPGSIATSTSQYIPMVYAVLGACQSLATCTQIDPLAEFEPAADGQLTSQNTLATSTFAYAFNGTTWDRMRSGAGDAAADTGILNTGTMIRNAGGNTWARATSVTADAIGATGLQAISPMVFNGTTWDRVREASADGLGGAGGSTGIPAIGPVGFTGANWNRRYTASSTFHGLTTTGSYITPVIPWSQWSITNTPATATQATATRAAGAAGVLNVATTVSVCLAAGATAQTPVVVNLRDGASGLGTVVRSWAISAPVNDSHCVDLSGLAIAGTAATAMTIEFAAAGVAASQQTVSLSGYSTLATNN